MTTTTAPLIPATSGIPVASSSALPPRSAAARLLLGARTSPVWARPSLLGLLLITAVLYIWDLSASGYANSFYAAAVEAGTKNWEALLFGSLDSSNFITVDKPPASIWVMALSGRIFGFSSWSMLVPEALMGVASVGLVYGTVRRALITSAGPKLATIGGLVGGAILAFTPAAALMFRFDNPDALLVLLMTFAGWCTLRALPTGAWRWMALAGTALGFAFLTKMLQGLLVLPAFGLVYVICANTTLRRRIVGALIGVGALLVSAGWYVAVVALWPASSRPYIGGSTNNTVLDLAFGYNGLGRIFGGSGNGGGGGGGNSSFGGATGLQRLFSSEMGLEISWLLPAALVALILGFIAARGRGRTDPVRAGLGLMGGWLIVTGLVFSYMSGTIHPYYTVALAPAIAGVVAIAGATLWTSRNAIFGRVSLAALIAISGFWGFELLSENSTWLPWLRWTVLFVSLIAALVLVLAAIGGLRRLATAALIVGMLAAGGGSIAYSIATASVAHTGSIPSVGATSTSSGFGGGGAGFGGGGGNFGGGTGGPDGTAPTGTGGNAPTGTQGSTSSSTSSLNALLEKSTSRWAAAVDGSQSAASLELATGSAVMAIGGWSDDPAPTLAQFEDYVKAGDIHYYVVSGNGGGFGGRGGGTSTASAIQTWVEAHYTAETVGASTVYDLTK